MRLVELFLSFPVCYHIIRKAVANMSDKEIRLINAFRSLSEETMNSVENFLQQLLSDPNIYPAFQQEADQKIEEGAFLVQ